MGTRRSMLTMGIAIAMATIQAPPKLATTGYKLAKRAGGFVSKKSKQSRIYRSSASKYKPHQGEQECARRLRVGSSAWHASQVMV